MNIIAPSNCEFKSRLNHLVDIDEAWEISLKLLEKLLNFDTPRSQAFLKSGTCGRLYADDIADLLQKGIPLTAAIGITLRFWDDIIRSSHTYH